MPESFDFIFERANSALITQDFKYAERLLTNALKKYPNMRPADREKIELLLARIYGDIGDLEKSLAAYLRLHTRKPDDTEIMNNLGRIYRHLTRYQESIDILEESKRIGGSTDEVLYNLAKTYKRMHNYEKAAEYFSLAIELNPDHAHAYDRLGNLYVLTGETDKAIEMYKDGLRVDSNHPYLNFHLAVLLQQQKRFEEAIIYFSSALRINPVWPEALSGTAAAYLQLDNLDKALNTYRTLLRITGESAPLYTELGYLFEKKQLPQEAEQYYYDALAIDDGYEPAATALAQLLKKKQQYDEALSVLAAAEIAPANSDNHSLRLKAIELCLYARDYAKANELFQRLSGEYSEDINALKLKGELFALTGETEKAENMFNKILQSAPATIEFRRELAEHYLRINKYQEAKTQLELFLKFKPADISSLMMLGKTEALLNNPEAAYREYQKVLEVDPNAAEARDAISRLFQEHEKTAESLKTDHDMAAENDMADSTEENEDSASAFDPEELPEILQKKSNLSARTKKANEEWNKEIRDRLERLETYGTSIEFLQDIVPELNRRFDAKQYSQVIKILAEKIAANLTGNVPLPQQELSDVPVKRNGDEADEG